MTPKQRRDQNEAEAARNFTFYAGSLFGYADKPSVYGSNSFAFDSDEGRGPLVGCLACGETRVANYGFTPHYLVTELSCGECGAGLVQIDGLYTDRLEVIQ